MMDVEIEAKRAEKNAEKVRARKNRKATYFCEKRDSRNHFCRSESDFLQRR